MALWTFDRRGCGMKTWSTAAAALTLAYAVLAGLGGFGVAADPALCANASNTHGVCYCGCGCDWRYSWLTQTYNQQVCGRFCAPNCGADYKADECPTFTSCDEIEKKRDELLKEQILNDRHSYCFPGTATVQLRSGVATAMENLRIGDEVLAGAGRYSRVFAWGHREPGGLHAFVVVTTNSSRVTLSSGHYLPVVTRATGSSRLATARSVEAGDLVRVSDGALEAVVSVSRVARRGLFNPHTHAGTVVVDGIQTSCFTDALHPAVAARLLWPVSAAARVGWRDPLGAWLHGESPWVARLARRGPRSAPEPCG